MPRDEPSNPAKRARTAGDNGAAPVSVTLPQILTFGGGCSTELPKVLRQLGLSRPMVVTDSFILGSGLLTPILAAFGEASMPVTVFSGCVPDPTTDSVNEVRICNQHSASALSVRPANAR